MKKLIKCKNDINKEMTIEEVLEEFGGVTVQPCNKWKHTYELDDLKQMAYMSIMKAYEHYDIKKNIPFVKYSAKIINNDIINYHKLQDRQKKGKDIIFTSLYANVDNTEDLRLLDTIKDEQCDIEKTVLDQIINDKIMNAIKRFTKEEQEMIRLSLIDGMTCAEIGAIYGVTRACISYRVIQLKKKLRLQLADEVA